MHKRLQETPIEKEKGILGTRLKANKKLTKKTDYLHKIEQEIEQAEQEKRPINGDKITKEIQEIRENQGQTTKHEKLTGCQVLLITNSGEAIWYENVKAGKLKIKRTDEKTAIIDLPKQKLLSMKYGTQEVPIWIAHENELVALPGDTEIDSALAYQNIEEIISNRKNFEAQTIKAWENLSWQILLGVIIIIGLIFIAVPMMTGKTAWEMLPTQTQDNTTTTTQTDTNNNTSQQTVQEIIDTWDDNT